MKLSHWILGMVVVLVGLGADGAWAAGQKCSSAGVRGCPANFTENSFGCKVCKQCLGTIQWSSGGTGFSAPKCDGKPMQVSGMLQPLRSEGN